MEDPIKKQYKQTVFNHNHYNEFFYKEEYTPQQVVDIINEKLPISIKKLENLVNRVHLRYPLLTKTEIAVIVKGAFETMRDLLILKKRLKLDHVFYWMNLFVSIRPVKGVKYVLLKVKLKTKKFLNTLE
jgi:hypothetical protein